MPAVEKISLFKGNKAAGVHLFLHFDGSWHMDILTLVKKNNKLSIDRNLSEIELPDKISEYVPSGTPICLSIEGKGIIHRKISTRNDVNPVNQILPNAQPAEFMVQTQTINDSEAIVSIIRNESLIEVLQFFRNKGYYICRLFLGPFALDNIWPFVINHAEVCYLKGYKITRTSDSIEGVENLNDAVPRDDMYIAGERIPVEATIPFANALSFFLSVNIKVSNTTKEIGQHYDEFIYSRAFRFLSYGFLAALMGILLINFLLFANYSKKVTEVSVAYKSGIELIGRRDKLAKELKMRQILISESGLLGGSRFSFYSDQLAKTLPTQLTLTRLELNPLFAKPKKDSEINYDKGVIQISGKCPYSRVLYGWIEMLKKELWVEKLEILQYKQDSYELPGDFVLKLNLK